MNIFSHFASELGSLEDQDAFALIFSDDNQPQVLRFGNPGDTSELSDLIENAMNGVALSQRAYSGGGSRSSQPRDVFPSIPTISRHPCLKHYTLLLRDCKTLVARVPEVFSEMLTDPVFFSVVCDSPSSVFGKSLRDAASKWWSTYARRFLNSRWKRHQTALTNMSAAAATAEAGGEEKKHLAGEEVEEEAAAAAERDGAATESEAECTVHKHNLKSILTLTIALCAPYRVTRPPFSPEVNATARLMLCADPSVIYLGLLLNCRHPYLPPRVQQGMPIMHVIAHGWGSSVTLLEIVEAYWAMYKKAKAELLEAAAMHAGSDNPNTVSYTGGEARKDSAAAAATSSAVGGGSGKVFTLDIPLEATCISTRKAFAAGSITEDDDRSLDLEQVAQGCLDSMRACTQDIEAILWWARCRIVSFCLLTSQEREVVLASSAYTFFSTVWDCVDIASTILSEQAADLELPAACSFFRSGEDDEVTGSRAAFASPFPAALAEAAAQVREMYACLVGTISDISTMWRSVMSKNYATAVRAPNTNTLWNVTHTCVPRNSRFAREHYTCYTQYWQLALLIDSHITQVVPGLDRLSRGDKARIALMCDVLAQFPEYYPALTVRTLGAVLKGEALTAALDAGLINAMCACLNYFIPAVSTRREAVSSPRTPASEAIEKEEEAHKRRDSQSTSTAEGRAEQSAVNPILRGEVGDHSSSSSSSSSAVGAAPAPPSTAVLTATQQEEQEEESRGEGAAALPVQQENTSSVTVADFEAPLELSFKAYTAIITVMDVLHLCVSRTAHTTINPVSFLLTPPTNEDGTICGVALCTKLNALFKQRRYATLAASAMGLFAACTHHSMRDIAPALVEHGVVQVVLEATRRDASSSRHPPFIKESSSYSSIGNNASGNVSVAPEDDAGRREMTMTEPLRFDPSEPWTNLVPPDDTRIANVVCNLVLPTLIQALTVHETVRGIFIKHTEWLSASMSALQLEVEAITDEEVVNWVNTEDGRSYHHGPGGSGTAASLPELTRVLSSPPAEGSSHNALTLAQEQHRILIHGRYSTSADDWYGTMMMTAIKDVGLLMRSVPALVLPLTMAAKSITHSVERRVRALVRHPEVATIAEAESCAVSLMNVMQVAVEFGLFLSNQLRRGEPSGSGDDERHGRALQVALESVMCPSLCASLRLVWELMSIDIETNDDSDEEDEESDDNMEAVEKRRERHLQHMKAVRHVQALSLALANKFTGRILSDFMSAIPYRSLGLFSGAVDTYTERILRRLNTACAQRTSSSPGGADRNQSSPPISSLLQPHDALMLTHLITQPPFMTVFPANSQLTKARTTIFEGLINIFVCIAADFENRESASAAGSQRSSRDAGTSLSMPGNRGGAGLDDYRSAAPGGWDVSTSPASPSDDLVIFRSYEFNVPSQVDGGGSAADSPTEVSPEIPIIVTTTTAPAAAATVSGEAADAAQDTNASSQNNSNNNNNNNNNVSSLGGAAAADNVATPCAKEDTVTIATPIDLVASFYAKMQSAFRSFGGGYNDMRTSLRTRLRLAPSDRSKYLPIDPNRIINLIYRETVRTLEKVPEEGSWASAFSPVASFPATDAVHGDEDSNISRIDPLEVLRAAYGDSPSPQPHPPATPPRATASPPATAPPHPAMFVDMQALARCATLLSILHLCSSQRRSWMNSGSTTGHEFSRCVHFTMQNIEKLLRVTFPQQRGGGGATASASATPTTTLSFEKKQSKDGRTATADVEEEEERKMSQLEANAASAITAAVAERYSTLQSVLEQRRRRIGATVLLIVQSLLQLPVRGAYQPSTWINHATPTLCLVFDVLPNIPELDVPPQLYIDTISQLAEVGTDLFTGEGIEVVMRQPSSTTSAHATAATATTAAATRATRATTVSAGEDATSSSDDSDTAVVPAIAQGSRDEGDPFLRITDFLQLAASVLPFNIDQGGDASGRAARRVGGRGGVGNRNGSRSTRAAATMHAGQTRMPPSHAQELSRIEYYESKKRRVHTHLMSWICEVCCGRIFPLEHASVVLQNALRQSCCKLLWCCWTSARPSARVHMLVRLLKPILTETREYFRLMEYVAVILTQRQNIVVNETLSRTVLPAALTRSVKKVLEELEAQRTEVSTTIATSAGEEATSTPATLAADLEKVEKQRLQGEILAQLINLLTAFKNLRTVPPEQVADRRVRVCHHFNATTPPGFCWFGHHCDCLHPVPWRSLSQNMSSVAASEQRVYTLDDSQIQSIELVLDMLGGLGFPTPLVTAPERTNDEPVMAAVEDEEEGRTLLPQQETMMATPIPPPPPQSQRQRFPFIQQEYPEGEELDAGEDAHALLNPVFATLAESYNAALSQDAAFPTLLEMRRQLLEPFRSSNRPRSAAEPANRLLQPDGGVAAGGGGGGGGLHSQLHQNPFLLPRVGKYVLPDVTLADKEQQEIALRSCLTPNVSLLSGGVAAEVIDLLLHTISAIPDTSCTATTTTTTGALGSTSSNRYMDPSASSISFRGQSTSPPGYYSQRLSELSRLDRVRELAESVRINAVRALAIATGTPFDGREPVTAAAMQNHDVDAAETEAGGMGSMSPSSIAAQQVPLPLLTVMLLTQLLHRNYKVFLRRVFLRMREDRTFFPRICQYILQDCVLQRKDNMGIELLCMILDDVQRAEALVHHRMAEVVRECVSKRIAVCLDDEQYAEFMEKHHCTEPQAKCAEEGHPPVPAYRRYMVPLTAMMAAKNNALSHYPLSFISALQQCCEVRWVTSKVPGVSTNAWVGVWVQPSLPSLATFYAASSSAQDDANFWEEQPAAAVAATASSTAEDAPAPATAAAGTAGPHGCSHLQLKRLQREALEHTLNELAQCMRLKRVSHKGVTCVLDALAERPSILQHICTSSFTVPVPDEFATISVCAGAATGVASAATTTTTTIASQQHQQRHHQLPPQQLHQQLREYSTSMAAATGRGGAAAAAAAHAQAPLPVTLPISVPTYLSLALYFNGDSQDFPSSFFSAVAQRSPSRFATDMATVLRCALNVLEQITSKQYRHPAAAPLSPRSHRPKSTSERRKKASLSARRSDASSHHSSSEDATASCNSLLPAAAASLQSDTAYEKLRSQLCRFVCVVMHILRKSLVLADSSASALEQCEELRRRGGLELLYAVVRNRCCENERDGTTMLLLLRRLLMSEKIGGGSNSGSAESAEDNQRATTLSGDVAVSSASGGATRGDSTAAAAARRPSPLHTLLLAAAPVNSGDGDELAARAALAEGQLTDAHGRDRQLALPSPLLQYHQHQQHQHNATNGNDEPPETPLTILRPADVLSDRRLAQEDRLITPRDGNMLSMLGSLQVPALQVVEDVEDVEDEVDHMDEEEEISYEDVANDDDGDEGENGGGARRRRWVMARVLQHLAPGDVANMLSHLIDDEEDEEEDEENDDGEETEEEDTEDGENTESSDLTSYVHDTDEEPAASGTGDGDDEWTSVHDDEEEEEIEEDEETDEYDVIDDINMETYGAEGMEDEEVDEEEDYDFDYADEMSQELWRGTAAFQPHLGIHSAWHTTNMLSNTNSRFQQDLTMAGRLSGGGTAVSNAVELSVFACIFEIVARRLGVVRTVNTAKATTMAPVLRASEMEASVTPPATPPPASPAPEVVEEEAAALVAAVAPGVDMTIASQLLSLFADSQPAQPAQPPVTVVHEGATSEETSVGDVHASGANDDDSTSTSPSASSDGGVHATQEDAHRRAVRESSAVAAERVADPTTTTTTTDGDGAEAAGTSSTVQRSQPWEGSIDPLFLVELPGEVRSEIVFNSMELIRGDTEYERFGRRTRIVPEFLSRMPEETQQDIMNIEERWVRVSGSGQNESAHELFTILQSVDGDVRRDVLLSCNLDDLREYPELFAQAQQYREEARQLAEQQQQQRRQEVQQRLQALDAARATRAVTHETVNMPADIDVTDPWDGIANEEGYPYYASAPGGGGGGGGGGHPPQYAQPRIGSEEFLTRYTYPQALRSAITSMSTMLHRDEDTSVAAAATSTVSRGRVRPRAPRARPIEDTIVPLPIMSASEAVAGDPLIRVTSYGVSSRAVRSERAAHDADDVPPPAPTTITTSAMAKREETAAATAGSDQNRAAVVPLRVPTDVLGLCISQLRLLQASSSRAASMARQNTPLFETQLVAFLRALCVDAESSAEVVKMLLLTPFTLSTVAAAVAAVGGVEATHDPLAFVASVTEAMSAEAAKGDTGATLTAQRSHIGFISLVLTVLYHLTNTTRNVAMAFLLLPDSPEYYSAGDGPSAMSPYPAVDSPLTQREKAFSSCSIFALLTRVVTPHIHEKVIRDLFRCILRTLSKVLTSLETADVPIAGETELKNEPLSDAIIEHPRHSHRLQWRNVRNFMQYTNGFVCNICGLNPTDNCSFHCHLCTFDLCATCALRRRTLTEDRRWVRRSAYYMLGAQKMISAALELLRNRRCDQDVAAAVATLISRGIVESGHRDGHVGGFGGGGVVAIMGPPSFPTASPSSTTTAIYLVEQALADVARRCVSEIRTCRKAFKEALQQHLAQAPTTTGAGATSSSTAPGTSAAAPAASLTFPSVVIPEGFVFSTDAAIMMLYHMNIPSSVDDSTRLLFLPYSETARPEPRDLTLLWHAVPLYLEDVTRVLQRLPEGTLVPLPPSVLHLMLGYCQYYLSESRLAAMSASASTLASSRTNLKGETERFMVDTTRDPSLLSDSAAAAAAAAAATAAAGTSAAPSLGGGGVAVASSSSAAVGGGGGHPAIRGGAERQEERRRLPRAIRRFLEANRATLNTLLYWNAGLLNNEFAFLKSEPSLIDFSFKLNDFRASVDTHKGPRITLTIDRTRCLLDSFKEMQKVKSFNGPLQIRFRGEEGTDAGGLTREWFHLLSEEIVNESYALFIHSKEGLTYQPNPLSDVNASHLEYFHFAGVAIGLAVANNVPIDIHFTRAVYRHMIGIEPVFEDLESVDPELYASLKWALANDVTDLGLTFSVNYERFGVVQEDELIPNGKDTAVTNSTKFRYVRLLCEFYMTKRIEPQLREFLQGFYAVIPRGSILCFTEQELELLICGMPDIDIEDLRANTVYEGYTSTSPQIRWFWETVASMSKEDRANLLQFTTGASKVPHGGFSNLVSSGGQRQKFTVCRWEGNPELLPQAHTCFNKIDLPEYPTAEALREKLMIAITFGSMGFTMM